jgi:hypothetical protein
MLLLPSQWLERFSFETVWILFLSLCDRKSLPINRKTEVPVLSSVANARIINKRGNGHILR